VADELVAALTDPVRQRLADLAAGDSDQPADQVRNLYRETRNDRVGGLAEHAALAAYAAGQLAALRHVAAAGGRSDTADGPVAVRWVFDACSPDCLDNSLVAGVPVGQPFPTGHLRPPAFPGCRCLLAPAAGDPSPRGRVATPAV